MPSTFSPEFLERIRQPPPPPFVNWRPWQRKLFGWGTLVVWLMLVGGVGICLTVILQLPVCGDPRADFFNSYCHTTAGVGLCIAALLVLYLVYLRFLVLISQIAYIPKNIYGVDEE
jgi:membrane-anchored glycerophosphoryl diester phosphodiesterase (GDPDase)